MHIINQYEFDTYSHKMLLSKKYKVCIKEITYNADGFEYNFKDNDIIDAGKINTGFLLSPGYLASGAPKQIRFYRSVGALFAYLRNKYGLITGQSWSFRPELIEE